MHGCSQCDEIEGGEGVVEVEIGRGEVGCTSRFRGEFGLPKNRFTFSYCSMAGEGGVSGWYRLPHTQYFY